MEELLLLNNASNVTLRSGNNIYADWKFGIVWK